MALFELKSKFKELRNTVMQLTPIEIKVRECTSNDSWGAKVSDKQEIAEATYNYEDFKLIMAQLWKRMADSGKNWRHVYKGLQLLEYLIANGSERVIEEAKDQIYAIRTLKNFQYVDENGKDQGALIRELSKKLVAFIQDDKAIEEEREKAKQMRDKFEGFSRTESRYKASHIRNKTKNTRPATKDSYDDDYEENDRPRRSQRSHDDDEEQEEENYSSKPSRKQTTYDEGEEHEQQEPVPVRKTSNVKVKTDTRAAKPRPPSFEQGKLAPAKQEQKNDNMMDMFFPTEITTASAVSKPATGVSHADPFADPFGTNDNFPAVATNNTFNPRGDSMNNQQAFGEADFEADFDDSFGEKAQQPQQQNELFDFTQGLVDLSLSEKEKKKREEELAQQQQQNQSTKMTIGQLKKLKAQSGQTPRSFSPQMSVPTQRPQVPPQQFTPQQFPSQQFPSQQFASQQFASQQFMPQQAYGAYPPQHGAFQHQYPQAGFQQGGFQQYPQQRPPQQQSQQGFDNSFF
jgi:epsin